MGGKRIADETKERILARIKQGIALREVARENGVSLDTVRRLVGEREGEIPPSLSERLSKRRPPKEESDAPDNRMPPEFDPADMHGSIQKLFQWMLADAGRKAGVGDRHGQAQLNAAVKALAPILDRLERRQAEDRDVLRISRHEIEEGMAAVTERIAATLARPLLCAECSRRLSVEWGEGGRTGSATGDATVTPDGVTPGRHGRGDGR